jgi:hypothetical protein
MNDPNLPSVDGRLFISFRKDSVRVFYGTFIRKVDDVMQTIFPQGFEFH